MTVTAPAREFCRPCWMDLRHGAKLDAHPRWHDGLHHLAILVERRERAPAAAWRRAAAKPGDVEEVDVLAGAQAAKVDRSLPLAPLGQVVAAGDLREQRPHAQHHAEPHLHAVGRGIGGIGALLEQLQTVVRLAIGAA